MEKDFRTDFRSSASMVFLSDMLSNPEWFSDEYVHRPKDYASMSIYEYLADAAVCYADALIDRLGKS